MSEQIFTAEEMGMLSRSLEASFNAVGLADVLKQQCENTNNHLDEGFFQRLSEGYHLVVDGALKGC